VSHANAGEVPYRNKGKVEMPSFGKLFMESGGRSVSYKGKIIQMVDVLRLAAGQNLVVKFESASSDWRQGVYLTTDGVFEVNDQIMKKSVVLWQDTAPVEVLLRVQTKKGECRVRNVWDRGNGVMDSWHNGAAMIVENALEGRRYRCNDGRADEDFDDLVFSIRIVG
jgi:hypothetical protein